MTRRPSPLRALLLGLTLAGLACDELVEIPNVPAVVSAHGLCQPPGSDRWYLRVGLQDAEQQDLDLRLTTATGETLLPGPTGSGLRGLPSARPPETRIHLFEWLVDRSDAPGCEALPADLPGPAGPCVTVPAGGPGAPLAIVAFVDDGAEISQVALSFEAVPPEACEPTP